MKLFGKKKEEEIEEDDDLALENEENLENKRLRRKLKDLHSENKKKRIEPPKPWGKKERIIVGGFFLLTTALATGMFLVSHDFKLPGLPRITLNKINFKNLFGEEVIKIGQKSVVLENDQKAETAVSYFKKDVSPLSGHYGFLVTRLPNGPSYGVSNDEKFQGASLLKVPLMALMYTMSEEGSLDLDTVYTLKETDKVKGSGTLYTAAAGTTYTYRRLAELMGKNSDRTAYKVMKEVIGDVKIKNYLSEVGMVNTNSDTGFTTPNDMGLIFKKIWDGSLINEVSRDEILGFLTNTSYEKWITAGVPENVSVAHKFGQDEGVMADGGIIKGVKPYILIIMGQGITQHDADLVFPKISEDIYNIEVGDK